MKVNLLAGSCFHLLLLALCLSAYVPQAGAQSERDSASTQGSAPQQSNIVIENWVKPDSGWLYVLDPKPNTGGPGGRVWLIDPGTGTVKGSIRTGDNADFALSPDGTRLYIASVTQGDTSELAVIDTAEGRILKSGTVDNRALTGDLPPFSTMAVSADGLALRILIVTAKSEDVDSFLLATFDTRAGEFLPGIVYLGNCGPGRFISYQSADHFDYLCPRTNRVRLINVDANSHALQNRDITLPWERRVGAAEAIEVPGSQDMAIVRGDGAIVAMNLASQEFADTSARPGLPNRIPPAAWPTSPDGSRVYLGYNKDYNRPYDNRFYLDYGRPPNIRPERATASEFRLFDTHTWKKVGTIKTKTSFWSAAIGKDGKVLYAMAPQKHSVLVIDTVKMRQVGVFKVGGMPALAVVAP